MYENSDSSKSDRQGGASENVASPKAASKPTLHRCSYCGTKFERASSPCMPFCSIRCHRIDLGNWLNESYGLPWDGEGEREMLDEE